MKNLFYTFLPFILLFYSSLQALSQGRYGSQLPRNSLVTLTSKSGTMYYGIDNYVQLDTAFLPPCSSYYLETSKGMLLPDIANIYFYIPQKPGKTRFSLYCIEGKDSLLLGYRYFNINWIPDPQLTLNDKPISTPITLRKSTFLNCDSLGVYFSDDIYGSENWLTITEYDIGYTYGGFHVSHVNKGNKINAETQIVLQKLGPDHVISLRAKVEAPGKISKELPIYRIQFY